MKKLVSFSLIALVVASCSGTGEKKIISRETKKVYTPLAKVNANRKLAIEISGMSCEHACGGSIRMGLKETNAVDRVSFDFQADRKFNTAYITFDKSKISADEIVAIIEKLNDKQFKTGKSSSTAIESVNASEQTSETTSSSTKSDQSGSKVEVSSDISMPNIFKFFSRIIS